MTINHSARTISLTKREMNAARRVASPEYKELQTARRDYPGFTVVLVKRNVKSQRETYKGLTYAYMEKYIQAHDDEARTVWKQYKIYRGDPIDPNDELPVAYNYRQMKEWFLGKYKEIAKFYEDLAKESA